MSISSISKSGFDAEKYKSLRAATIDSIGGFHIQYLIVAGGGSGGYSSNVNTNEPRGGAGGAGGFRNSFDGEETGYPLTAPEQKFLAQLDTSYTVTVGGGGSAVGTYVANSGNDSQFGTIVSSGGGRGNSVWAGNAGGLSQGNTDKADVGSGGGSQANHPYGAKDFGSGGTYGQGGSGGYNTSIAGGGGAGGDATSHTGGVGKSSSATGTSVTYATGGDAMTNPRVDGPVNTGNGGSGVSYNGGNSPSGAGGNGGSGIVVLKWATADATIGATRTGLTDGGVQIDGDYSYIVFTDGTGTITFS